MQTLERTTRSEWTALPYHGFGVCANPACRQVRHLCGTSPTTRVCLDCFEFTYNCCAPRRRSA
jgi:hypothetical protein